MNGSGLYGKMLNRIKTQTKGRCRMAKFLCQMCKEGTTDEFGTLCSKCEIKARKKRIRGYGEDKIRSEMEKSLVPPRYLAAKMEDFPDDPFDGNDIEKERGFLISGPSGTGKTHLAAAIVRELIRRAVPPEDILFYSSVNLSIVLPIMEMEARQRKIEELMNVPYLILDDLGTEKMSEFVYSALYSVLNYRYDYLKHTTVTTNLHSEDFDMRMAHRLGELGYPVKLEER